MGLSESAATNYFFIKFFGENNLLKKSNGGALTINKEI